ncbi:hypothetical protein [Polaromonas hydrogenivorans]|uniref:Uncharacterized protein n=1 Tax=Polaromonas hydrogenivorans TaxID=335476 RepID=A0AAU7LYZ7_9BURK
MAEHNVSFLFLERKLNGRSALTGAPAMGTMPKPVNGGRLASKIMQLGSRKAAGRQYPQTLHCSQWFNAANTPT